MNLPKERWFFIAVLYKDCSLQFAYSLLFRELTNMNLPKERWFFIALLYKGCSLQFAYRGFFRELNNMNLPKERWCMENLLVPGHLQHPEPFFAHIFCKHSINIYEKCSKALIYRSTAQKMPNHELNVIIQIMCRKLIRIQVFLVLSQEYFFFLMLCLESISHSHKCFNFAWLYQKISLSFRDLLRLHC